MSDRYLTFVARASGAALGTQSREWRVRTYGMPTETEVETLRREVAMWAYPDHDCEVRVLNEPYVESFSYEPVNGFLSCRPGPRLPYPPNPSAHPPGA